MSHRDARSILGRRLRLALIGGGGALIGPVHRVAARLDDQIEIVAGVMSSDPARSVSQAAALGLARGYADVATMLAAETGREDGADAVSISTPNDTHVVTSPLAARLATAMRAPGSLHRGLCQSLPRLRRTGRGPAHGTAAESARGRGTRHRRRPRRPRLHRRLPRLDPQRRLGDDPGVEI